MIRSRHAAGVTLIELVLALAVSSVLVLGLASAVLVAVRSVPAPGNEQEALRRAEAAAQRLAGELSVALAVPVRSEDDLTLILPDRDGDGVPERVRWWLAGGGEQPLRRRLEGASAEEVTGPLDAAVFRFALGTDTREHPGVPVAGEERTLSSFTVGSDTDDHTVKGDRWYTLPLVPELPAGAVGWTPTSLSLQLESKDEDEPLLAELFAWAADRPTGPPLESVTLSPGDLPDDAGWVGWDWTEAPRFGVDGAAAVRLRPKSTSGDAEPAKFTVGEAEGFLDVVHLQKDAEPVWEPEEEERPLHRLRGRAWTPGPAWTTSTSTLRSVDVELGVEGGGVARAGVAMPSRPPAAGWRLRADFSVDPSLLDGDADGVGDFLPSVPESERTPGTWVPGAGASLSPRGSADGLPGVTRFSSVLRPRSGSDACWLTLRFGRGGGLAHSVRVAAEPVDGGHRVAVSAEPASGDGSVAMDVGAGAWFHLGLDLDPDAGRVAVRVDGETLGSLAVTPKADDASLPVLRVGGVPSGFEFDELAFRGGDAG